MALGLILGAVMSGLKTAAVAAGKGALAAGKVAATGAVEGAKLAGKGALKGGKFAGGKAVDLAKSGPVKEFGKGIVEQVKQTPIGQVAGQAKQGNLSGALGQSFGSLLTGGGGRASAPPAQAPPQPQQEQPAQGQQQPIPLGFINDEQFGGPRLKGFAEYLEEDLNA
jgi:hypothetical protein